MANYVLEDSTEYYDLWMWRGEMRASTDPADGDS